jgi:1,4-alpha-glucan branching enzyme
MGGEFAQWHEWNHDRGLDWQLLEQPAHQGVQRLVADLNRLYRQEPALHRVDTDWTGFAWLQVEDADNSVIAWVRRGGAPGDEIVIVCNWAAVVRDDYLLRAPAAGVYREVLNTDARSYGGSNVGNHDKVATQITDDGTPRLHLRLPALGVLMLKQDPTAHG